MNTRLILNFLKDVMANNNRPWFQEHKAEYEAAKAEWERGVAQALERIISFDIDPDLRRKLFLESIKY